MSRWRTMAGALVAAAALVVVATEAPAAPVPNGGFERQDFSGWSVREFGPGSWGLVCALPRGGSPFPPPEGSCAALTNQGEVSSQILSRVVKLRRDRRHRLTFQIAYENQNTGKPRGGRPGWITPNSLQLNRPNQQYRVDVMRPGAPIRSTDRDDVLMQVAKPDREDPLTRGYFPVAANLTEFAGRKVRLRFAVAVTQAQLNLNLDAVKITTRRP